MVTAQPTARARPGRAVLAVVVGTLDRLPRLRALVESVRRHVRTPYQLHVTDAGSGDGTQEYLRRLRARDPRVVPHLRGRRLGQARALNDVFARLDAPLACWLSDDNVVVPGGLDAAVAALLERPRLGLLGLKVRDLLGPHARPGVPYVGAVSSQGVLNVNQGLVRTPLLRRLGGFAEGYVDYGIDPDLTTRVLLAGWDVAYTRRVAVHHYRGGPEGAASAAGREGRRRRALELYDRAFAGDARLGGGPGRLWWRLKRGGFAAFWRLWARAGGRGRARRPPPRDHHNAFSSRYASAWDLLCHRRAVYLVQKGREPCPGSW